MYKLRIASQAESEIKKIAYRYQKAIIAALSEIREDPTSGKPLTRELTGRFSYKVGVYRIVYKVNINDKTVDIFTVGHRASVYNKR